MLIGYVGLIFSLILADAYQHVRNHDEIDGRERDENELVFLKGLLDSPAVTQLIKVGDCCVFGFKVFVFFLPRSFNLQMQSTQPANCSRKYQ